MTPGGAVPAFPAVTGSLADKAAAKRAAQARAADLAKALGLGPGEGLEVRTVHVHADGSLHTDEIIRVKYNRTYAGLPVVHGMVGVHLTRSGELRKATLFPPEPIAVPSTDPAVDAEAAARAALAALAASGTEGAGLRTRTELVIDARSTPPVLAWRTTVTGRHSDGGTVATEVFADAQTGRLLTMGSLLIG